MLYLGMDVAKIKLDCCLLLDEASGKRKTKVVKNTQSSIVDLLAWIGYQTKRFSRSIAYHHRSHGRLSRTSCHGARGCWRGGFHH